MRVLVRIRPLLENETQASNFTVSHDSIQASHSSFQVSRVYTPASSQVSIFEESLFPIVADVIKGGVGSVIAYGQTGSGKRFSVEGTPEHPGLLPYSILSIFKYISEHSPDLSVSVSWYEIYNEKVHDLFMSANDTELKIRDRGNGLFVDGLTILQVTSPEEVFELINNVQLDYDRKSHTIFTIHATNKVTHKEGRLNFIVMFGSEQEHLSLNNFRETIDSLYKKLPHVYYHKSKLTLVLKESLSSPSTSTILICTVSPSRENSLETAATLSLATKALRVNIKSDKVLEVPNWSFRPRASPKTNSRTPDHSPSTNVPSPRNTQLYNHESTSQQNYNHTNGAHDDHENSYEPTDQGRLSMDHLAADVQLSPRSQDFMAHSDSRFDANGSDTSSDRDKRKTPNPKKRQDKFKYLNFTPQSPPTPSSTSTPSPPLRFALTTSPPTPHKERAPNSHDPTVEVQKLRMKLQKAVQEINGFRIYKEVIDKNLVSLRDSLTNATESKTILEKELKAKELQIKKKNKEIESLNKTLKESSFGADRATKDRATMKHRVDELEKVEAERLKTVEDAKEEAKQLRSECTHLHNEYSQKLEVLRGENLQLEELHARSLLELEDKDKELSVVTEEVVRLTQLVEDGSGLRDEVVSLKSTISELQQQLELKEQHIAQLTQTHAANEKIAARDSRTSAIMAEATSAQLRKQISDLQVDIQTLRGTKDSTPRSTSPSSSGRPTPTLSFSTIPQSHNPKTAQSGSSLQTTTSPLPSATFSTNLSNILASLPSRPSSQSSAWTSNFSSTTSSFQSPPILNSNSRLHEVPSISTHHFESSYHPIPSTPTSISNPLLDTTQLTKFPTPRTPTSSSSSFYSDVPLPLPVPTPMPLPTPPPPQTPTPTTSISLPSTTLPHTSYQPAHISSSTTSGAPEDPHKFQNTNWAQYLQTLLPNHSEEIHNSHTNPPPFNLSQVQQTIDNVRKLVQKPVPSLSSSLQSSQSSNPHTNT